MLLLLITYHVYTCMLAAAAGRLKLGARAENGCGEIIYNNNNNNSNNCNSNNINNNSNSN